MQILDPFNTLFDEGHTAFAPLSNAQAEQACRSNFAMSKPRWRPFREASGNGPRNDLGIIAGEPFERRQCAHDLTCAYPVHLCNNGRFDRHFHSSRTAERINSTAARGRHAFAQPKHFLRANCITHVSPPPFAPTVGAPACRRAARSPPPHPAQDPPGSVPRSAARRSVDPGAATRGRPRRVGPAR